MAQVALPAANLIIIPFDDRTAKVYLQPQNSVRQEGFDLPFFMTGRASATNSSIQGEMLIAIRLHVDG